MAEVLPGVIPRRIRYDWDNWTDGNQWKLTRGTDFFVPINDFRNRCYTHKLRHSYYEVRVRAVPGDPNSVCVQFFRN